MRILILGEIIGKIGRRAIMKELPKLKNKYGANLVLANVENLAHGKGITVKTINEILKAGVDFCTSGDHFWSKKEEVVKVLSLGLPVIRPVNFTGNLLGQGFGVIEVKNQKILIINLIGRVFMKEKNIGCPFKKFNEILAEISKKERVKIVLVDFHAEATAEKQAFAYYVDGRASVVFGTHTHVPTADCRILPKGTAFVTDIGLVGAKESVIGFLPEGAIKRNLGDDHASLVVPEKGRAVINGLFVRIDRSGRAKKIEMVYKEVMIK